MKDKLRKIAWAWIKFWGKRFYVYKDNKEIGSVLFYKHRIYILSDNLGV